MNFKLGQMETGSVLGSAIRGCQLLHPVPTVSGGTSPSLSEGGASTMPSPPHPRLTVWNLPCVLSFPGRSPTRELRLTPLPQHTPAPQYLLGSFQ